MTSNRQPFTVAERLRRRLDQLTAAERKLAQVLLGDYPMAGLETVAHLAQSARVSAPTVLRLVAKLDFSGYPEFQAALRREVQARLQSPLSKGRLATPATDTAFDHDLLGSLADTAQTNIRESLSGIPRAEFDAVTALLADSKRSVHLLGGRFTSGLVSYLFEHLRIIRPKVFRVSGQSSKWAEQLLDLGRRDVLLVFDIRRYQQDVIGFAQSAAAQGARVVLVTDQWLSPVARCARHVFALRITAGTTWDSAAAPLVLAEALIEAICLADPEAVRARVERLERLRG